MTNVYFHADAHAGHKNVHRFRTQFESEQEHFDFIAERYNSTVRKNDVVYFLGDVAFTKERLADIAKWSGRKILILGNHCHTADTEILTKNGWVFVDKISYDDEILSVDLNTNIGEYVKPTNIIQIPNVELYSVKGRFIDEVVSYGHSVIYDNKRHVVSDLVGQHKPTRFKYAFNMNNDDYDISDDMLRLLVHVICDSTMLRSSVNKCRVQFKLSKQRKIDELEMLLIRMGFDYTKRMAKKSDLNKLTPYYIRIYGDFSKKIFDLLNDKKEFPDFFKQLSYKQAKIVLDTIQITDGRLDFQNLDWSTTNKSDVDMIQLMCVMNNIPFSFDVRSNSSGFANGKIQYRCKIRPYGEVSDRTKVDIMDCGRGDVYGVSVKHQTIVVRRNGCVSVSGNCTDKDVNIIDIVNSGTYEEVHSLKKYKSYFWLSHVPVHPDELRGRFNVHGHCHNHMITLPNGELDDRYFNACIEHHDYNVVSYDHIRSHFGIG